MFWRPLFVLTRYRNKFSWRPVALAARAVSGGPLETPIPGNTLPSPAVPRYWPSVVVTVAMASGLLMVGCPGSVAAGSRRAKGGARRETGRPLGAAPQAANRHAPRSDRS